MNPPADIVAQFRQSFAEVEAAWRLRPALLEHYRLALERILDRLDSRIAAVGGWQAARFDPHARAEMFAAELLLDQAARAYATDVGVKVIKGRAAGGRARPKPTWHSDCEKRALILLRQGRHEREITGILAASFGKSKDAVRRVLVNAAILKAEKKAA